jgi:hypothetical protein
MKNLTKVIIATEIFMALDSYFLIKHGSFVGWVGVEGLLIFNLALLGDKYHDRISAWLKK